MKTNFSFILLYSFFIAHSLLLSAQQRGVKPVQVTIEGTVTTLYKESHALLIGVSIYTNGLPSLPGVTPDILAVKSLLEKNGFSTQVVMNPDHIGLTSAFNDFIGRFGQVKESRLVFYFAGHGYTKNIYGNDIGYLLPKDCPNPEVNPTGFQNNAMPMGQIELFAQQIQSKHALFLFDACFSGAIFAKSRDIPGIISYKTTQPVRQFITSGSADETVPDNSIFRKQFINAFTGDADLNKDGFLTGTELGDYLQSTVVNYSHNSLHPQFGKIRDPNLDKGDIVFVLNISPSIPHALNPNLKPLQVEEIPINKYGTIELSTEINGSLYIDGDFVRTVSANKRYTLKNIIVGDHTLRITGDESWESSATVEENGTASIDAKQKARMEFVEMVFVKGGTFSLGSNEGHDDEKPVHNVTISDFYMGKYEVTRKQWKDVMENDPSFFLGSNNCPVENVSWFEIQGFIQKLNQKTGRNYRLPTEAEWEFAARGGNNSHGYQYSGSNAIDDIGWYEGNSDSKTHPVGQKQPNELGIYDMTGNVYEWCSDWYGKDYYASSPTIDPKGPSSGSYRVIRGGCWTYSGKLAGSDYRDMRPPGTSNRYMGFRLASSK